jgi:hypothetical protein
LGYLKKYTAKYLRLFLTAVCVLSLEAACDLFQPTILSKIVDVGIKNKDLVYVLRLGGIMLLVTALGASTSTPCAKGSPWCPRKAPFSPGQSRRTSAGAGRRRRTLKWRRPPALRRRTASSPPSPRDTAPFSGRAA